MDVNGKKAVLTVFGVLFLSILVSAQSVPYFEIIYYPSNPADGQFVEVTVYNNNNLAGSVKFVWTKDGASVREATKSFSSSNAVTDSNPVSAGYWKVTAYVYDRLSPPQLINTSSVSFEVSSSTGTPTPTLTPTPTPASTATPVGGASGGSGGASGGGSAGGYGGGGGSGGSAGESVTSQTPTPTPTAKPTETPSPTPAKTEKPAFTPQHQPASTPIPAHTPNLSSTPTPTPTVKPSPTAETGGKIENKGKTSVPGFELLSAFIGGISALLIMRKYR